MEMLTEGRQQDIVFHLMKGITVSKYPIENPQPVAGVTNSQRKENYEMIVR